MTNRSGSSRRMSIRVVQVAVLALLAALLLPVPAALAAPVDPCERQTNNTYRKLLECVTLDGVREHQAALQEIADNSRDPVYAAAETRTDGISRPNLPRVICS